MSSENITRAESAQRAGFIQCADYNVTVDLTPAAALNAGKDPERVFWSHTTVSFDSALGASWLNLIADEAVRIVLDDNELPLNNYRDSKVHFSVAAGSHQLSVGAWCRYSHTGEGLHRFTDPADSQTYLYTQFETADARRMYACFEQPDLKASFQLSVRAPVGWRVFSNAPSPKPNEIGAGVAEHIFAPTKRISTYLTALIAGPYHVVRDSYQGSGGEIPLGVACRQSIAQYLDAERILAITKSGFQVYEAAFNVPYAFGKYDQIFVPEFNAGAMENAGCITFRDEYLFRSKATAAQYEARDDTILHEMAHMWFGDLVTMKWWDDLWLNESFAEWAATWCLKRIGGPGDPWVTFANSRKDWAYRQDQLPSTHPIAADMVDLEAVELNFDGITYAKGASVLKQLVAYVGEEPFLAGLRAYFAKHAWGNTVFDDLLAALAEASGRDLSGFAAEWLQTTGPNTLRAEFDVADGHFTRLAVRQEGDTLRHHRMAIGCYESLGGAIVRTHRIETDIAGELTQIPEAAGLPRPALLLLNDDDLTYAKVRLDDVSLETLRTRLKDIESPLARALCWGAAWDMCRDAELPAAAYLDIVLGAVETETDLTGVQASLLRAGTAVDFYSPRSDRVALGERLAQATLAAAQNAEPGSDHALAFFRAFIAAAGAGDAELLRSCLAEGRFAGLDVDADLRWRITTALARLGVFGDPEIDAELQRDFTDKGAEKAAGARAARPTADAKADAWEAAVLRDDTPNETHYQICANFWRFGQDDVLSPYIDKYLAVAESISEGRDGWGARSTKIRQHVLSMLFPSPLIDRPQLERIKAWRDSHDLSDYVLRQVVESIDAAERALRCQEA
ncbi:MAG: aminopeptidase N [Propionibacteriaceae bacterium]|jgi:aminopeptidase N|nr:aminopeptidase N [Propionibacteriaceae bacterium]